MTAATKPQSPLVPAPTGTPTKQRRVVVFANEKGGVGKSTSSANVAASMAADYGFRVLFLDLDGQCNSTSITVSPSDLNWPTGCPTVSDVLAGTHSVADAAVQSPHHENLFVIPGNPDIEHLTAKILENFEETAGDVSADEARVLFLRAVRQRIREQLLPRYDVVVIDTPPNRGTLPLQIALSISDAVMAVGTPDKLSSQGVKTILLLARDINKRVADGGLPMIGLLMNKHIRGRPREEHIISEYRQYYHRLILDEVIPNHDSVAAAVDSAQIATVEDYRAEAARLLRTATGVIIQRMNLIPPYLPSDIIGRLPDFADR